MYRCFTIGEARGLPTLVRSTALSSTPNTAGLLGLPRRHFRRSRPRLHGHVGGGFLAATLTPKQIADVQFVEIADLQDHHPVPLRVWAGSKYIRNRGKGTAGQIAQGGVVVGSVASLTVAGVQALLAQAREALAGWQATSAEDRRLLLQKLAVTLHEQEGPLGAVAEAEAAALPSQEDGAARVRPGLVVEAGIHAFIKSAAAGSTGADGTLDDDDHEGMRVQVVRCLNEADVMAGLGRLHEPAGGAVVFVCEGHSALLALGMRQCAEHAGLPPGLLTVLTGREVPPVPDVL